MKKQWKVFWIVVVFMTIITFGKDILFWTMEPPSPKAENHPEVTAHRSVPDTPPTSEEFYVESSTVPVMINNHHRALKVQYGLRVDPGKSVRMWLMNGSFETAFGETGNPIVSGTPPSGPPTPTVSNEAQENCDGFKFLLLEGSTERVKVRLEYER